MLKEIYIDNYRCLSNFRIHPSGFQLWLGDNGSGKSSVFDALRSIQVLLQGRHVDDIFDGKNLTAWDNREKQTFSVKLTLGDDKYDYCLTIEHSRQNHKVRIGREELKWNDSTFYQFDGKDAHLYRIHRDIGRVEEGTAFPADWSRSIIPTIAERDDNWPLLRFREAVLHWLILQPMPHVISHVAGSEASVLSEHAENFAEWYRHISQENPGVGYKAKERLEDVLIGFDQISLKEAGKSRRLTVTSRIGGKDQEFDFLALSDGQRQLIILYTILEALQAGIFTTLFIDEPDNFVSLREIQPWIGDLKDVCEETDRQAIIVSHHPEIINMMARGEELWFSREEGAHVVVKQMPVIADLPPAEVVARGWENE